MGAADKWVDRAAGPVVRPYALIGGRTEPASGEILDLIAVVVTAGAASGLADDVLDLTPEHRKIMNLCRSATTVADVASSIALPVGVVRVLLADLIMDGRITVLRQRAAGERPDRELLKEVLHGLRTL